MALRKLALPATKATGSVIELPATSHNQGATGQFKYKQSVLKELAAWMARRFKPDVHYGEFELARAMDVHRVIADDWLSTLVQFNMVNSHIVKKPILDLQALAFYIPKALHKTYVSANDLSFDSLKHFDPWNDRSLDGIVWMSDNPQMFCDKYYTIDHHEYYLLNSKQRIRPNRHMFIPVSYFTIQRLMNEHGPQTPQLRQALDRQASGEKTMLRPS